MARWKRTFGGYIGEGFGADVRLQRKSKRKWVLVVDGTEHPLKTKRPTFDHAEAVLGQIKAGKPATPPPKDEQPKAKSKTKRGKAQAPIVATPPLKRPPAKAKSNPLETLNQSRQDALTLASRKGVAETVKMLERAQRELDARLARVTGGGAGDDSFSAAQLRNALVQIRVVLRDIRPAMKEQVLTAGELASSKAAEDAVAYMQQAQRRYYGVAAKIPFKEATLFDRAVTGTRASILQRLEDDPKRGPGILSRYGDSVVERFEKRLQQRFIQGKPWAEVRADLIADSPFLKEAPAYWAERIVRTEIMGAHNTANHQAIEAVNDEVAGVMLKILAATFDDRTASDSYAVHGQIRRPSEPFDDWYHSYMHPPNRPNDREVVVPHSIEWPIPPELEPKSDAEVAARWSMEKRKGSPPPRPRRSTVPLERIGTPQS